MAHLSSDLSLVFPARKLWLETCNCKTMILLITPSSKAQECVHALQDAIGEPAHVAASFRQAAVLLRAQDYSALVLDQNLLDSEPNEIEVMLEHAATAIPVYVNFGISSTERVVRDLRAALQRRKRETTTARNFAEQNLRNELKGNITAMLLSCEMALQTPQLPAPAEAKMRAAYEQALDIKGKLGLLDNSSATPDCNFLH
jgi:hypothetical protein